MNDLVHRINDVFLDSGAYDWTGRYLNLFGGAGSGKSVFAADFWILRLLEVPGQRIVAARKVKATVRNSIWHLLNERIDAIGVRDEVRLDRTNLGFRIGDSEILTVGMDDPEKLKSISGITGAWIEEATELTEAEFDQLDLRIRGASPVPKQIVLSYNPISRKHWLKSRFHDQEHSSNLNCHSTYLDNEFVGEEYRDILDRLRVRNPRYYQVYALGEWGELEEGLLFKRAVLDADGILYDRHELPDDARGVLFCDPNLSKKSKGDTTGICRLLFSPSDQNYYLDGGACRSFSASADLLDQVFELYGEGRSRSIGFDGNVSQESTWTEHIQNYSRIRRVPVPLVEFKRYKADELAKNASILWSEGRIRVSRTFARSEDGQEFLSQLFAFAGKRNTKSGRKDDAPDSLISAVEFIHERGLAIRSAVADAMRKIM